MFCVVNEKQKKMVNGKTTPYIIKQINLIDENMMRLVVRRDPRNLMYYINCVRKISGTADIPKLEFEVKISGNNIVEIKGDLRRATMILQDGGAISSITKDTLLESLREGLSSLEIVDSHQPLLCNI
jgi:hypothetical protein